MGLLKINALAVCLCAGSVVGAEEPTRLSPSVGHVETVAHIYYNVASGEKVVTLFGEDQTAPAAGFSSSPVWSTMESMPCAEQGFTTTYFFGVDDNTDVGYSLPQSGLSLLDYGDIVTDTLVDCIHISWVTDHADVDADGDGVGDGVVGLSGEWTIWDADNGRELNRSTRLPIVSVLLTNLPADFSGTNDPSDPKNTFARYSMDLDLTASSLASNLMFEIGDSDGDLQGAAFGNNNVDIDGDGIGDGFSVADSSIDPATGLPFVDRNLDGLPDNDLDGDGLFDWAWTVRFYQPGSGDSNQDGVIDDLDGDIADSMRLIGVNFGAPEGTAIDLGDDTWEWEIDTSTFDAGRGSEDRFAMYFPPNGNGDLVYEGGYFFGGFACSGINYTPYASFEFQLLSPGTPIGECGDFNGDGVLNFFDISAYLVLYNEGSPHADMNGDGELNFFDISAFLGIYSAGCP
ncbi:hypothetical protein COB72_08050 [bacterium]|nr:MAG: hypothetical protein COB72_08050 [bacterium]